MKKLFSVSVFGLLMFALVAVSSQSVLAQEDATELYTKFSCCWERETPEEMADMSVEDRQESVNRRKEAIAAGKEFVQKYGSSKDYTAQVNWLKENLPTFEAQIDADEKTIAQIIKDAEFAVASAARFKKFNDAYKAKNWAAMFQAGDVILDAEPEFYDVAIVMASVGFDEATAKRDALNDETIKHANYAIDKLAAGKKPATESCAGPYYNYKTKDFKDCVPNALGYMYYTIGYIKHYRQKKTSEAIPYYFKASQSNSAAKDEADAYRVIGLWYITESQEVTKNRNEKTVERNAETEKAEPDVEKIDRLDLEINAMLSVERGYADRAIDAYSRAYALVPVADRSKEFGAGIFGTLKKLYSVRYYEEPEKQTDAEINMNVSMVKTKSMPNPETKVQPVFETKPDAPVTTATPTSTTVKSGASRSRTVTEKTASTTIDN